jgi:hypothetical protein
VAHPQLLAQLLGRPLPPAPVEEGPADVPPVAPAVQPAPRQQTPREIVAQLARIAAGGRLAAEGEAVTHGA